MCRSIVYLYYSPSALLFEIGSLGNLFAFFSQHPCLKQWQWTLLIRFTSWLLYTYLSSVLAICLRALIIALSFENFETVACGHVNNF